MLINSSIKSIIIGHRLPVVLLLGAKHAASNIAEVSDNSEELISAGLNRDDPAFADSYKINLWLVQPAVLPL